MKIRPMPFNHIAQQQPNEPKIGLNIKIPSKSLSNSASLKERVQTKFHNEAADKAQTLFKKTF